MQTTIIKSTKDFSKHKPFKLISNFYQLCLRVGNHCSRKQNSTLYKCISRSVWLGMCDISLMRRREEERGIIRLNDRIPGSLSQCSLCSHQKYKYLTVIAVIAVIIRRLWHRTMNNDRDWRRRNIPCWNQIKCLIYTFSSANGKILKVYRCLSTSVLGLLRGFSWSFCKILIWFKIFRKK